MSKVIAFLYKHGKAMTSAVMLVTLGVTMMAGALLSYKSASASTLVSVSDLLSESAPSSASNHTITFTAQNGVSSGGSIRMTFQSGFNIASIVTGDIDAVSGVTNLMGTASVSGQVLEITTAGAIAVGEVVQIKIGKHAVTGGSGTNQIVNPGTSNVSYSLFIETKTAADALVDDGTTYLAIVPTVELTAEVAPYFFFEVDGIDAAGQIDGFTVSSASLENRANFGLLTAGTPVTMGSSLSARTNATNGFVVTLEQNHNMLASSNADIDSFDDGVAATTGATWSSPAGTLGSENTYGHLGFHSEDGTLPTITSVASVSNATNGDWFGLNGTAQATVWTGVGGADGVTQDVGHIDVGYRVQISALQEVGRYESRLMYIATATF